MMADFFDAAGQYLTNRFNQATMPFTNPSGYFDQRMNSRFGDMYETEEEKRRREELERQQRLVSGPVAPATAPTPGLTESEVTPGYKPQPFKQTLTIDPATGQQRLKVEGDPRDFTAANANTPTLTMPSAPMAPAGTLGPSDEELLREQEQRRQYDMMMARPAGPVAPAAEPVQLAAAPQTTRTDVTAPTTGSVAAPAAPQAVSPEQLQQQMMAQDIQEGPVAQQLAADRGAGINWFNVITAAQQDPAAMERIARDPNTPEQWRRVAASQSAMTLDERRKMEQAEARARDIIASGGRSLPRALQTPSEEGSYLKAYLFGRLGMQDLARAEQAKLTTSWQQVFDNEGNAALIQVRGTGMPIRGINNLGEEIPAEQLTAYATGRGEGLRPVVGVGTVEKEIDGKTVRGRVITAIRNGQTQTYVESGGKRYAYTGDWKDTGISAAAEKAVAQKEISLKFDPIIKGATTTAEGIANANLKYGLRLALIGTDQQGQPIIVDRNTDRLVSPDAQGNITVTSSTGTGRTGVPAGGTQRFEIGGDIQRTAGQEAVKGVENFSQQTSDRAGTASETAGVARRIRNTVDQNPQVVGLLTKKNDKGNDMITAAVAAIDAGLGGSDAIEQAAKQLNLDTTEQAVYEQVKGDLVELALARARENKGQGTFTDFERRLFASTTGDLARNQAAAIKYRMEIFEYAAEKAQRKSEFVEDYRLRNPNATVGKINNAFREFNKQFDEAFEKRMNDTYIRPKQPRVIR